MKLQPLSAIDFYKADHRSQYPNWTNLVYANFTPRSARLAPILDHLYDDKLVLIGLQAFVMSHLIDDWSENFFKKDVNEVVRKYKRRMDRSLGEDAVSVDHIRALHKLGYLPIMIKALPEGSRVNIQVPVLTVKNTLSDFFWLVNYLETVISAEMWKPCTTATIAYEYKKLLTDWAEKTGGDVNFVPLQGHDFSARGMSGIHDAARSGLGHLAAGFIGTDNVLSIDYAEDYYYAEDDVVGVSVPATEHSVMCMGMKDGEIGTFKRLITEIYPGGIVSIVSDTWDFWKVMTEFTVELKDEILNRKPNALGLAKVVFRPDSGDPVKILCGYNYDMVKTMADVQSIEFVDWLDDESPEYDAVYVQEEDKYFEISMEHWPDGSPSHWRIGNELTATEVKGAVECLWDVFGGTETEKGYRVLNERVGLIYGDSITLSRAEQIMQRLAVKRFASTNVVLGIGSYTYQYITRDSFGFAMKATYGEVDEVGREIFKDPKTGDGGKKSAKGLLRVEKEGNDFVLYDRQTIDQETQGELKPVFQDGVLLTKTTLADIRERLS